MTSNLTDRLTTPDQGGLDPAVLVPLLRLLAEGEPVQLPALAAAAGLNEADLSTRLAAVPDTEYDEEGRIIGQGLTLRPTPHRFTVAGEELYTWCALDTLIFPALLDRPASIESVPPTGGGPIRVCIDQTGVTRVEPATAVVSLVDPGHEASIRSSFCNQVHYFTSPEDAAPWLAGHPGAQVVPVAEAYQLATTLIRQFVDRLQAGPAPADVTTASRDCHCC